MRQEEHPQEIYLFAYKAEDYLRTFEALELSNKHLTSVTRFFGLSTGASLQRRKINLKMQV